VYQHIIDEENMILKKYKRLFIPALATVLLLTGCASANKRATTHYKMKDDEIVVYENNAIVDPSSNLVWHFFDDNPTTFYRYKLNSSNALDKLPSLMQMVKLLEKVSYQLGNKKHHGNLAGNGWFDTDCDFLTSSSVTTPEGEVLYEVVHWNPAERSIQKSTVTGGDLVVILILNENY